MKPSEKYTPEQYRDWISWLLVRIESRQALATIYRLAQMMYTNPPPADPE